MTTERDLIQRLARKLDRYRQVLREDRTLTDELADEARAYLSQSELDENWYPRFADWLEGEMPKGTVIGDPLWWTSKIADYLARWGRPNIKPEPEGVTDEELHDLWLELYGFHPDSPTSGDVAVIARAVLARWGSPAVEPKTNGQA